MFRIAFITFHTYYCMYLTCKILKIGAIKSRLYQDYIKCMFRRYKTAAFIIYRYTNDQPTQN